MRVTLRPEAAGPGPCKGVLTWYDKQCPSRESRSRLGAAGSHDGHGAGCAMLSGDSAPDDAAESLTRDRHSLHAAELTAPRPAGAKGHIADVAAMLARARARTPAVVVAARCTHAPLGIVSACALRGAARAGAASGVIPHRRVQGGGGAPGRRRGRRARGCVQRRILRVFRGRRCRRRRRCDRGGLCRDVGVDGHSDDRHGFRGGRARGGRGPGAARRRHDEQRPSWRSPRPSHARRTRRAGGRLDRLRQKPDARCARYILLCVYQW